MWLWEKCLVEKILKCSAKNGIDFFGDHQDTYRKYHCTATAGVTL